VERTVEYDLERKIPVLLHYNRAYRASNDLFDWLEGALGTFIWVLHQNGGKLSQR
jgi:hypothetical protein